MTDHDHADETATEPQAPQCPKCAGSMWDNREGKRNPRAPDYKCKTDGCDGVIWPPRQPGAPSASTAKAAGTPEDPACPICGGRMWDDRASKRNPRAPDFKCRNRPKVKGGPGCEGVIWPPRDGAVAAAPRGASPPAGRPGARPETSRGAPAAAPPSSGPEREFTDDEVPDFGPGDDDLPF